MFDMLYQYAYAALKNPSYAEEAVQDTFRIACSKPEELLDSPNPRGWLMVSLKNVIQNMRRSFARQQRLADQLTSAAELQLSSKAILAEDDIVALQEICISVIGKEDFRLFWRVVMDGLTMGEAAREFGIHTETCKKRIQRSRAKLKKYLGNYEPACPHFPPAEHILNERGSQYV
jgi:RNA polymerase sigma-70 factor (ECF subfamily)